MDTYFSNTTFLMLISVIFLISAVSRASTMSSFADNLTLVRNEKHASASREMRQAREAARGVSAREDRIGAFLKLKIPELQAEESYRRLLPRNDICESDPDKNTQISDR
jgi:hypothetical protein